jgi:(R,R)-butanediol dehydrogenase/meso-butanediol dehydrogenase/diacetyl reductase
MVNSGQVRIEVEACGICGSDLHEYFEGPDFIPVEDPHPISGATLPVTMGHEICGTVTETGSAVEGVAVGDCVAVNPIFCCEQCSECEMGNYHLCQSIGFVGLCGRGGGFADSVVVAAEQAVTFSSFPIELGAFVEPYAVAVHAVKRAGVQAGDAVAIFGGGPIGLAVAQVAQVSGADPILLSEPREFRRKRASECGVDVQVDPTETAVVQRIRAETSGGVNIAFEVAGAPGVLDSAVRSVAPTGDVVVVSVTDGSVRLRPSAIVEGERSLTGTRAYLAGPRSHEEYETVVSMLADGQVDPAPLLTDQIGLDRIVAEGFTRLREPGNESLKILVRP